MGCNCGKKNKQQKMLQQVQASKQTQQTSGGNISASDYLKAQQQLVKKKK